LGKLKPPFELCFLFLKLVPGSSWPIFFWVKKVVGRYWGLWGSTCKEQRREGCGHGSLGAAAWEETKNQLLLWTSWRSGRQDKKKFGCLHFHWNDSDGLVDPIVKAWSVGHEAWNWINGSESCCNILGESVWTKHLH
jgi:hypothetical protein